MSSPDELLLMETIVEESPAIVFRWLIQEGWPVEYVSRNIAQLGYTQAQLISGAVSWPGITHPDDVPRLEREVEGFLAQGVERWSQTYRIRAADGSYRWMRDWNLLLRDALGVPRKIQGIVLDISREKIEEQQRAQAQQALEQSLARVISGFLPICAWCKAIRDDAGGWIPIDTFISSKSPVQFTHGCCPNCEDKIRRSLTAPSSSDEPPAHPGSSGPHTDRPS